MNTKQKILAGIDIGSSKITTIVGVPTGEEVKIIGVASVPSKGIRKGQIVDIEEATQSVISSVEAAERMAGYDLSRVFVSVGGPHVFSQNSTGVVAVAEPEGEITAEDVERVIDAAQAITIPSSREIIHVIPRSFTVDGQEGIKDPVGMAGVRLEVDTHIVTASSTAMRNLEKCVFEVGAKIEGFVASGLASAEAVLTETEKELGVVLIDIGGGVTNIVIFVEGAPYYTSILPVGAKNVDNDLAIGLRVSLDTAAKIKMALSEVEKRPALPEEKEKKMMTKEDELDLTKWGIVDEPRKVSRKTLVEGIIKPRLNEIFGMVEVEMRKSGAVGLTPAGVVITGGGAQTVGVVQAAKKILASPVRVGTPQRISGLIDDVQTPDYATAVGLLLYGAKQETSEEIPFYFGKIGKKLPKLPVEGVAQRAWELIKSLLP